MRLAVFGLTISSSWGNGHATPYRALLRALHAMGHQISFFEKDVPWYATRRDFSQCDYCRLILYADWTEIRRHALETARESDVVICASYCPAGARIVDEMLALRGPLRVFYDLDTPITLDRLARQEADYLRADQIPEFDLVLSFTGGAAVRELRERWGARRCAPLYGCVDPAEYRPTPPLPEFDCALSYMGTFAPDRQGKLAALFLTPARMLPNQAFVLAGSLYPHGLTWPGNLRRYEHVSPGAHPALYCSSRATLNLTRAGMAQMGHCPSGRFFEASACGTPILTDQWDGLKEFFDPGAELFVVQNAAEVVRLLQTGTEDLRQRAKRARERTLDQHTGRNRAQEFIRCCERAVSHEGDYASSPPARRGQAADARSTS